MADRNADSDVTRLVETLAGVIKASRITRQALERKLGWSAGYVSRILKGTISLQARHVMEVLRALGMSPAVFFALAFPASAVQAQGSEIAREMARLEGRDPSPAEEPPPDPILERQIRRTVLKMVGELARLPAEEPEQRSA